MHVNNVANIILQFKSNLAGSKGTVTLRKDLMKNGI